METITQSELNHLLIISAINKMPFKSQKQRAKCYALKAKGKNGSWNCDEWESKTKKKKKKKA